MIYSLYEKYVNEETIKTTGINSLVESMISELDGVYSFYIVDMRETPRIILARDPFGVRSLYYANNVDTKELYIASELKSIPKYMHQSTINFPAGHYSINGNIRKNYISMV